MRSHLLWISLALAACVKQATYDKAIAENQRLKADLEAKQDQLAKQQREQAVTDAALADLRRQKTDTIESLPDLFLPQPIVVTGPPIVVGAWRKLVTFDEVPLPASNRRH
jgi:hypothetical protein